MRSEPRARRESSLPSAAIGFLALCCCLFAGMSSAFGAGEAADAGPVFGCEVRYNFREHFRDAKPGEKNVSAPAHEREALPLSRGTMSNASTVQMVEGRVAHLPFRFLVKITRTTPKEQGTLEVNVLDSAGKPVRGFPQTMANPLTRTGDSSRKEFEIPIEPALKTKIEKTLLAKDQFLTHVDLIVGMDDDFLSAAFPK